jgi:hypothetical protein
VSDEQDAFAAAVAENFAAHGLRVVAGPGPLRSVLPEGLTNLAGRDDARACVDCYMELHEQFDRFPETYCQHRNPDSAP